MNDPLPPVPTRLPTLTEIVELPDNEPADLPLTVVPVLTEALPLDAVDLTIEAPPEPQVPELPAPPASELPAPDPARIVDEVMTAIAPRIDQIAEEWRVSTHELLRQAVAAAVEDSLRPWLKP